MTPSPGLPQNPALIVADTSALIQIVVSEEVTPLRILKQDYSIQLAVHEAVETEINWRVQKKFPEKRATLNKLFSTNTVGVLDKALLSQHGYKSAPALLEQIDVLGERFSLRIGRGEAYAHAAGNILGVPTLSQDLAAIWELINDGVAVQRPILRAFDLLVFGVQAAKIDWDACAKARKQLLKAKEGILQCFRNCSVEDGIAHFYLRLCDADAPLLGASQPLEPFDDRIFVRSVSG